VPTAAELANYRSQNSQSQVNAAGQALLNQVDGQYTGTTCEILQWGALKWGLPANLLEAEAVDESEWYQNTIGDIGDGVSLSILQIKSSIWHGTCPESPNYPSGVDASSSSSIQNYLATQPNCLSYNDTAFAVDYRGAIYRACMNGDMPYLANHAPTPGYPTYTTAVAAGGSDLLWGCMGVWYSGYWYDSGAVSYIQRVQSALNSRAWQSY
jgi:hypothetical protein